MADWDTTVQYAQPAAPPMPQAQMGGWGLLSGSPVGQFVNSLNQAVQSPTFQSGAAMVNAGAHGLNAGAGFQAGAQAGSTAAQNALMLAKQRREMEQMQLQDRFSFGLNPADKQWAGMPAGLVQMAQSLRDPSILVNAYKSKMDLDQQMKTAVAMGNIQAQNAIKLKQMENQLELQQLVQKIAMMKTLRGQPPESSQSTQHRYNPQTDALE